MKVHYYKDTDSLYIDLNDQKSVDSREVQSGIVLDFDSKGNLTGIDIDHASKNANLSHLEAVALPLRHSTAGEKAAKYSIKKKTVHKR